MRGFDSLRYSPPEALAAEAPVVYVVDDDPTVRAVLGRLLSSHAYRVQACASAEEFLAVFDKDAPGCLVLDLEMPGMNGMELHRRLLEAGDAPPTIFISGCADVPTCATALRRGALHFLSKPVDLQALLMVVEEAMRHDAVHRQDRHQRSMVESRMASLTPREREVLCHVMRGRLNKQIGADLGTAEKTVKVHRARAMEKMGVRSVAELVRMVERAAPSRTWGDEVECKAAEALVGRGGNPGSPSQSRGFHPGLQGELQGLAWVSAPKASMAPR